MFHALIFRVLGRLRNNGNKTEMVLFPLFLKVVKISIEDSAKLYH